MDTELTYFYRSKRICIKKKKVEYKGLQFEIDAQCYFDYDKHVFFTTDELDMINNKIMVEKYKELTQKKKIV